MKILVCLMAVGIVIEFNLDSRMGQQMGSDELLTDKQSDLQSTIPSTAESTRWILARNTVCNPRVKVCE